ncbi:GINS complex subunit [Blastocladiella emersonii ATCC 22665]|nr:GINS complex subunit [Blastocladiella emersonii ATCC 22665]
MSNPPSPPRQIGDDDDGLGALADSFDLDTQALDALAEFDTQDRDEFPDDSREPTLGTTLGTASGTAGGIGNPLDDEAGDDDGSPDLDVLTKAWVNERFAPELLPFQHAAVENLTELLSYQASDLAEGAADLAQIIKAMDVERVKFVLRSYLRTRLHKIEHVALFLMAPDRVEAARAILSPYEAQYAEKYAALLRTHLHDTVGKHLPELFQAVDEESEHVDMVPKPVMDQAVFVRILRDIGDVQLPDDTEPVAMMEGEMYLVRYMGIRRMLLRGEAELI